MAPTRRLELAEIRRRGGGYGIVVRLESGAWSEACRAALTGPRRPRPAPGRPLCVGRRASSDEARSVLRRGQKPANLSRTTHPTVIAEVTFWLR